MRDEKATLNGICRNCFPRNWPKCVAGTKKVDANTNHTRTSCERPKPMVITETNSGVSTRRHNNENVRYCTTTVVVSNHARWHSCSPPGYAWKHLARGLCDRFVGNCVFQSTDEPCRQKTHGAGPITTPDQYTNCRLLHFLSRNRLFRTAYEQASRDDFFKIPNPRIDSPSSWFGLKSRFCKALNLPRSGGIAPAHATDALNKYIRLDLKINQSNNNICAAGEHSV